MTTQKNKPTEASAEMSDREIVISREFDAPRELVWEAMTDSKQVVKWWGPRGFTTTIEVMEVRPGGVWKLVMHGPDGTDYPNRSVFKEVVMPEWISFSLSGGRKDGPVLSFEMTWTFAALENRRTRVTIRQVYATAELCERIALEFGAIEGGKQTLARLGEHLSEQPQERDFQISRVFDAPRELVWKVWTEPELMAKWWGPHNFTCPTCELDVRVGGAYRLVMRGGDGAEYPCAGIYREIVKPERIVMSMDLSGHPDSWWDMIIPDRDKSKKPELDFMQTVTLEEEVPGKTRLTIRTRFESKAIRDAMVRMGMNEGWSQSLERLGTCLSRL